MSWLTPRRVRRIAEYAREGRFGELYELAAGWYSTREVWNDLRAALGAFRYPHTVTFVAGLPKGGTTWLHNLISSVPGYNICPGLTRPLVDPGGAAYNHDICGEMFAALPKNRFTALKLHTRYAPEHVAILREFGIRTTVLWRDLRDMYLSRYDHVLAEPTHAHHELYKSLDFEEGLLRSIELVGGEYTEWIRGWTEFLAGNPGDFLGLSYEDLRRDTDAVFSRVLDFYGIGLSPESRAAIIEKNAGRGEGRANIQESKKSAFKASFRKGRVGGWREVLTERHKDLIKRQSGELLIRLGYEKDLGW